MRSSETKNGTLVPFLVFFWLNAYVSAEVNFFAQLSDRNLVDPASSHMLVSKIKPCKSQYKSSHDETANGSLKQL